MEEFASFDDLKRVYRRLHNALKVAKKLNGKEPSVLLAMLDVKSNPRYQLLLDSAVRSGELDTRSLDQLLERQLIRPTDDMLGYSITARGIWEVEVRTEGFQDPVYLVDGLDDKFFAALFEKPKPLSDKEKIIILFMISIRAFNEWAAVDLRLGDQALDHMAQLIEKTHSFLLEQGNIQKLKKEDIFGKSGNEHPVFNLIRHTDKIPRKTRNIFSSLGDQKFCLKLFDEDELVLKELAFLLWLIFGERLDYAGQENLNKFCLSASREKSIYIFGPGAKHLCKPRFDGVIPDAYQEYLLGRERWGRLGV